MIATLPSLSQSGKYGYLYWQNIVWHNSANHQTWPNSSIRIQSQLNVGLCVRIFALVKKSYVF